MLLRGDERCWCPAVRYGPRKTARSPPFTRKGGAPAHSHVSAKDGATVSDGIRGPGDAFTGKAARRRGFSGSAGDSLERGDSSRYPRSNCARFGQAHQFADGVRRLAVARWAPGQEQRARLLPGLASFGCGGFCGLKRHCKGFPAVQADDSPGSLGLGSLLHLSPRCGGPPSRRKARHRVSRISPCIPLGFGAGWDGCLAYTTGGPGAV
jgi:hypothetical protein